MKNYIVQIKVWDNFNERWIFGDLIKNIKAVNANEAKINAIKEYLIKNDIKVEGNWNRCFSAISYVQTGRPTPYNVINKNVIMKG